MQLIHLVEHKCNSSKRIYIGSSKGGYAALNFAFQSRTFAVCIAAPQYFLGRYLNCPKFLPNLKSIINGEISDDKIAELDVRLRNIILGSRYKPEKGVYIHYSTMEHTYDEHIKYLLADLRSNHVSIFEDISDYKNHSDLIYFFPHFLNTTLDRFCIC